jgi:hypothetical protein
MSRIQIRLKPDGEWHRRSSVRGFENETACGQPIRGPYAIRDYALDEHICKLCHSKHEIDTGKLKKLERPSDEHDDLFFDDDAMTPTDPDGYPLLELEDEDERKS